MKDAIDTDTLPSPVPDLLGVDQARARVIARGQALAVERIALASALDRSLAADVFAPIDVPGYANSAMDGFALRGADLPAEGEDERGDCSG